MDFMQNASLAWTLQTLCRKFPIINISKVFLVSACADLYFNVLILK